MKLCKCGCGSEIISKPDHRWRGIPDFIHGHNRLGTVRPPEFGELLKKKAIERHFTNNMRQEICQMYVEGKMSAKAIARQLGTGRDVIVKRLKEEGVEIRGSGGFNGTEKYRKGVVVLDETREKLREITNKRYQDPAYAARHAEIMRNRPKCEWPPESKASFTRLMKGRKHTEEARANMSGRCGALNPSFGIPKTSVCKEKISTSLKKKWLDREYVLMMGAARSLKPNKPESSLIKVLDEMYPGEWKYTGDFSFVVNGKNPDFVNCNGQKKIIELFGDYWHKGQNPQDRADIFSPFGYETLVIWECELKNMGNVKDKIRNFHELKTN